MLTQTLRSLIFGLGSCLALFTNPLCAADDPQTAPLKVAIHWLPVPSRTNYVAVEVSGLSTANLAELKRSNKTAAQWNHIFSVYAGQGELRADVSIPPMLGSYRVADDSLRFEPQFPLQPGVIYQAVVRPNKLSAGSNAKPTTSTFQLPLAAKAPSTIVTIVYPTTGVVPENLLKFYVHFSAPMSRGHIYDHIQLRDDGGKLVEIPFLEIDEELWDRSMTRLTLFIDPGRIKRGVRPLEEIGPALQASKGYSLLIDREWKDAEGTPLKQGFEKKFRVGPPDREPPEPKQWGIQAPAGLRPLEIRFPKPMDHALALRLIRILDSSGKSISGDAALENEERRWSFAPTRPWESGRYTVQIETTLEDLAGNNIRKPFDVDLFDGVQRRLTNSFVKLFFDVR